MIPGQAFWVDLPVGRGSEQHGRRPVVIVQAVLAGPASTTLCVPTSTSAPALSWRVEIELGGVRTVALTDQVRALDVTRLREPAGSVTADELRDIVAQIKNLMPIL